MKELETSIINTTQRWESTTTSYHLVEQPFMGKQAPRDFHLLINLFWSFSTHLRARKKNQWWSGYYSNHLQNVLEISFAFFFIIIIILSLWYFIPPPMLIINLNHFERNVSHFTKIPLNLEIWLIHLITNKLKLFSYLHVHFNWRSLGNESYTF